MNLFQRTILTVIFLFSCQVAYAKNIEQGVATYKMSINIHASLSASQAALKAMIPEFKHSLIQLKFNKSRYLSTPIKSKNNSHAVVKMGAVSASWIIDHEANSFTQFGTVQNINYFYSKELITDESLQLINESKTINGRLTKKAVLTNKTSKGESKYIIWYDPEFPVLLSPYERFSQIPGLIVKVENRLMEFELQEIEAVKVSNEDLQIPKGHREITSEQFDDLQEEAMEELIGGTNTKVIRTVQ